MSTLYKVTQRDELQAVNKWLEQHLPQSFAVFNFTRSILEGRWTGESIYALGWPSIRAVATGGQEPGHPAPDHYASRISGFIYATEDEDIEFLLNHDKVVDWSRSFMKKSLPERITLALEKIAKKRGLIENCHFYMTHAFYAKPGDIEKRPIPDGYRIRAVKPEPAEIDYCVSTWKLASSTSAQYLKAWVERFPSVCLVDSEDKIVSFEAGTNMCTAGLLHTREEARRKGFAKVVTSHLAEEFGKLNWDMYAFTIVGNEMGCAFHQSMGFKCLDEQFGFFNYDAK